MKVALKPQSLPLQCSVITSSTNRDLVDFFSEITEMHGHDVAFDLTVLRDADVQSIEASGGPLLFHSAPHGRGRPEPTFTQLMADSRNLERISRWFVQKCSSPVRTQIAALATYFPDVTSLYDWRRELAVDALTNAVRLGFALVEADLARSAIVEVVCGTILDPCECGECQSRGRIFVSDSLTKFQLLLDSLNRVVRQIEQLQRDGSAPRTPFAFGVELEPGETYVLCDKDSLDGFFSLLDSTAWAQLRPFVGLNLDIAHMKIAGVEPAQLRKYTGRIVHGHIADHPGMHTRDQPIGTWTTVHRRANGYRDYVEILCDRSRAASEGSRDSSSRWRRWWNSHFHSPSALTQMDLPFSGGLALELEGCNRISWVFDSLWRMRQIIKNVANYPRSDSAYPFVSQS